MTLGSLRAADYLESVLTTIESEALYVPRVDWARIAEAARKACASAQTTAETHEPIRQVLEELGDGHSFFSSAEELAHAASEAEGKNLFPVAEKQDDIGYLRIDGFESTDDDLCEAYASTVRDGIAAIDQSVGGWITDLRMNGGGNMWPMLEGLHPLLGDGVHGFFVLTHGARLPWGLRDGEGFTDDGDSLAKGADTNTSKPVAVLLGPQTFSSGEAIAVALRVPGARSFGSKTGGASTCNRYIELEDGAALFLTTGVFADRDGGEYDDGIEPDVECVDPVSQAKQWIWKDRSVE